MIVPLANEVRDLVVKEQRIATDRHQADIIIKVIEQLDKAKESLTQIQFVYTALDTRLEANESLAAVCEKCSQLRERVADIHTEFTQSRDVVRRLVPLNNELKAMLNDLDAIWDGYAKEILNPLKQHLDLVKNLLPDTRRDDAQRLSAELDKTTQNAPLNKKALMTFDSQVKQLQTALSEIPDMSDTVRKFLMRLGRGNGVPLNDIPAEVLAFCQQNGDKFKIMFVQDAVR